MDYRSVKRFAMDYRNVKRFAMDYRNIKRFAMDYRNVKRFAMDYRNVKRFSKYPTMHYVKVHQESAIIFVRGPSRKIEKWSETKQPYEKNSVFKN